MDQEKTRQLLMSLIVIINIVIPILIGVFWDLTVGGLLLVLGIMFVGRSFSILRADARRGFNPKIQRNNANAAGKTILVQIVDDFDRDLLPQEIERRLAEARAKAGPRDTVIPARFKVEKASG
jgi:hypothetical protein